MNEIIFCDIFQQFYLDNSTIFEETKICLGNSLQKYL